MSVVDTLVVRTAVGYQSLAYTALACPPIYSSFFFTRLHIVVKSAHYHSHVRPSVRSYQRFSHWMDLRDN